MILSIKPQTIDKIIINNTKLKYSDRDDLPSKVLYLIAQLLIDSINFKKFILLQVIYF